MAGSVRRNSWAEIGPTTCRSCGSSSRKVHFLSHRSANSVIPWDIGRDATLWSGSAGCFVRRSCSWRRTACLPAAIRVVPISTWTATSSESPSVPQSGPGAATLGNERERPAFDRTNELTVRRARARLLAATRKQMDLLCTGMGRTCVSQPAHAQFHHATLESSHQRPERRRLRAVDESTSIAHRATLTRSVSEDTGRVSLSLTLRVSVGAPWRTSRLGAQIRAAEKGTGVERESFLGRGHRLGALMA